MYLSQATVRRTLLRPDFRWRRPRHSLPKDPPPASKLQAITDRLLKAGKDTVIVFGDESDLHLLPVLGAMWTPKGRQARVPAPVPAQVRGQGGSASPPHLD